MNKTIESLNKLDSNTEKSLQYLVASLYKIDKEHRFFIDLKKEYNVLNNAEYIVYPNINNMMPIKFLDYEGAELLSYSDGISEFILISCDITINEKSISIKNPYIIDNASHNGSSFSW